MDRGVPHRKGGVLLMSTADDVPKSLSERLEVIRKQPQGKVRRWWRTAAATTDWFFQSLVFRMRRWAFREFLELIAAFSLLVAVGSWCFGAEDRRKQRHQEAWQIINGAQDRGGSGGRVDALQDLARDGVSLHGVDLSGAWLRSVSLPGARLSYATLDSSMLEYANLNRANLCGVSAIGADFGASDLRKAKLWLSNLYDTDFSYANLKGAALGGSNLRNSIAWEANLEDAYLAGADLSGAKIYETNLAHANLEGADLRDAIFQGVDLRGANLNRADLRGARLNISHVDSASLRQADLRNATLFLPGDWRRIANLELADLAGAVALPAFLTWAVDSMRAVRLPSDSAWADARWAVAATRWITATPKPDGSAELLGHGLDSIAGPGGWVQVRGKGYIVWMQYPRGLETVDFEAECVEAPKWPSWLHARPAPRVGIPAVMSAESVPRALRERVWR